MALARLARSALCALIVTVPASVPGMLAVIEHVHGDGDPAARGIEHDDLCVLLATARHFLEREESE